MESAEVWKKLGISEKRIAFLPKKNNWWGPAGETGPCGPDTEIFVDGVEIWNNVFMEYNKTADGKYEPLKQKNVDTGMGLERTLMILNGNSTIQEFSSKEELVNSLAGKNTPAVDLWDCNEDAELLHHSDIDEAIHHHLDNIEVNSLSDFPEKLTVFGFSRKQVDRESFKAVVLEKAQEWIGEEYDGEDGHLS